MEKEILTILLMLALSVKLQLSLLEICGDKISTEIFLELIRILLSKKARLQIGNHPKKVLIMKVLYSKTLICLLLDHQPSQMQMIIRCNL
jgi:hypothetical protein